MTSVLFEAVIELRHCWTHVAELEVRGAESRVDSDVGATDVLGLFVVVRCFEQQPDLAFDVCKIEDGLFGATPFEGDSSLGKPALVLGRDVHGAAQIVLACGDQEEWNEGAPLEHGTTKCGLRAPVKDERRIQSLNVEFRALAKRAHRLFESRDDEIWGQVSERGENEPAGPQAGVWDA